MKVEESEWSEKASLDTIGSSGIVTCKDPDINYTVSIS